MNEKDRMGRSDGSSLRLEKDHHFLLNMRCLFVLLYARYKKKKIKNKKIKKKLNRLSNIQQRNISHLTILSKDIL